MSDLWLNIFHGYAYSVNEQPQCTRETQLGEEGAATKRDNAMAWETFGKPKHFGEMFRVLKPKIEGKLVGAAKEEELLRQAYELMSMMVHTEHDREVYEAAILVMAAMGLGKETPLLSVQLGDIGEIEVFGYAVKELLAMVGRVLLPSLLERTRRLMAACIRVKDRLKDRLKAPCAQKLAMQRVQTSYDNYLRFRNLDGFFEGSMLLSLAAAGLSGAGLTVGVAGNVVEMCILTHDSYSVPRHFAAEDLVNAHRYTDTDVNGSIARAFKRTSGLGRQLRELPLPLPLKRALLNFASSYYLATFACQRYGYGNDYSRIIASYLKEKRALKSLETVHHMKNPMLSFEETVRLAFPEPLN